MSRSFKVKSQYHLAWDESSFFAKYKYLANAVKRFNTSMIEILRQERDGVDYRLICQKQALAHSSLSSAYYSVKGTARAHIVAFYKPLWLIWLFPARMIAWGLLGWWCHRKDIAHSNAWVELVGYSEATAPMCDVRQSVLRSHGEYSEALVCILEGLSKGPSRIGRCLLLIGKADVALHAGIKQEALDCLDKAIVGIGELEKDDPRQAARVYRGASRIAKGLDDRPAAGRWMLVRARKLAAAAGAKDQLLKQRR